jgi:hypothetical protein
LHARGRLGAYLGQFTGKVKAHGRLDLSAREGFLGADFSKGRSFL